MRILKEIYENQFDEESGLTTTLLKEIELCAKPSNEEYKLLLDAKSNQWHLYNTSYLLAALNRM